ncbi:MerR family regulatory protein [mine drainage metagenome]|uniref:MerR family regulatory protein n=1 Tax=mine drainage metagenome TaxID=410659 RepID=A0A1J5RUG3_9ZZZZ
MTSAEDQDLSASRRNGKSDAAFRTISEVADELGVQQHVLRFWESKFSQIKPLKRGGGRRYYRPEDVILLRRIRDFLYKDGYTIKGVVKILQDMGREIYRDPTPEPPPSVEPSAFSPDDDGQAPWQAPPPRRAEAFLPDSLFPESGLFEAEPAETEAEAAEIMAPVTAPPPETVFAAIQDDQPQQSLEPPPPAVEEPATGRDELLSILRELEDLRDVLAASRQGRSP